MCGLISILSKNKSGFYAVDRDIFNQLLYADVLRGSDATGVFGVNKEGNLRLLKQAAPAGWFLSSKTYADDFNSKIVSDFQMMVGHNRKATHGEKKDIDAHPFYTEPICLVHNGMISNHKELCKDSTVDSEAVCNAFAKGDFKDTLRDIEGAYAFIWYNIKEKVLYFIRNDKRPLFIIETSSTYILASEKELVEWICARNNQKIVKVSETAVSTLYSFDLEKRELKEEKLDLKPVSTNFRTNLQTYSNIAYLPHKREPLLPSSLVDDTILLLTDDNFKRLEPDFSIGKGDIITFEIEEIEDYKSPRFTGNLVRVSGAILNCPKAPITVIGFMPIIDLEEATQEFVASGKVMRLEKTKAGWNVWINATEPSYPVIKTHNDLWITNDMWMSENFDCHCLACNDIVTFEKLDTCDVYLSTDDTKVLCPKCIQDKAQAC